MPGYRFANTFAPQTEVGQSLQNIGLALFGGKTPREQQTEEALISSRLASADASRASAGYHTARAGQVTAETNAFNAARAPEAQQQGISFLASLPLPTVRSALTYLQSGGERPPDVTDDVLARVSAAAASHGAGYADKTISPQQIAQGYRTNIQTSGYNNALNNPATIPTFGQANAALEGKPIYVTNRGGITTNNFTGARDESGPTAQAGITHTTAQTATEGARKIAQLASAGASNALRDQRMQELKTGVRIGAPMMVDDPVDGPMYTSPSAAVGRAPYFRPTPDKPMTQNQLVYTQDENGNTIAVSAEDAVAQGLPVVPQPRMTGARGGAGATASATPKPRRVTPNDQKFIESSLSDMLPSLGVSALDDATKNSILRQAEIEYGRDPAVAHREAVQRAVDAIAPQGLTVPWQLRSFVPFATSQATAVGGPRSPEAPAPAPAPATPPAAPPRRGNIRGATVPNQAPAATAPAQQPAQQPATDRRTPTLDEFMTAARRANPGQTDEALRAYYVRKYGGA